MLASSRKRSRTNASKSVASSKYKRARPLGLPATRGFRTEYGKYRRSYKEKKTIDTAVSFQAAADQVPLLLNGVAQGSDFNNRIGRKITMKSITVRLVTFCSTLSVSTLIRYFIVLDTQCNAAAATVTDVFSGTSPNMSTYIMNLNNRDRFKVLMDKVQRIDVGANTTATPGIPNRSFIKKYIKLNTPVTFGGTGATVGSLITNSLLLFVSSDSLIADGNKYTVAGNIRVRFTDD